MTKTARLKNIPAGKQVQVRTGADRIAADSRVPIALTRVKTWRILEWGGVPEGSGWDA